MDVHLSTLQNKFDCGFHRTYIHETQNYLTILCRYLLCEIFFNGMKIRNYGWNSIWTPKSSVALCKPIYVKLKIKKQYYEAIICITFQPNWSINMEIPAENLFQPENNLYLSLSRSSCKSFMLNYLNKTYTQ